MHNPGLLSVSKQNSYIYPNHPTKTHEDNEKKINFATLFLAQKLK